MDSDGRGYDSTQEMRAMILAALPYPSLPIMLRRLEDGNALGDEILQTSHDVISNMLVQSCAKGSAGENANRPDVRSSGSTGTTGMSRDVTG